MSKEAPVLEVSGLNVTFTPVGFFSRRKWSVRAVRGVTFAISKGETLGLVGESGSGKSTTGRAILDLVPRNPGSVHFKGEDLSRLSGVRRKQVRTQMQMIFQDPYSSLDPSLTIESSVSEPLRIHTRATRAEARETVRELLQAVGLRADHADRYPFEFSGGQRQRIAIARALALRPELIVCDEPVSALDVSTQSQIINLLRSLQEQFRLTYLFISHDLSVMRHVARRTAVMYLGQLVEIAPTEELYSNPAHPYTEALWSAVPRLDVKERAEKKRIILPGSIPDPVRPPPGCPFHPRCRYAMDICRTVAPERTRLDNGGEVACHLQTSGPRLGGKGLQALADAEARGGAVA